MSEQPPQVVLDWKLWCARHLEPFRADWPRGAAQAMVAVFQACAADERVSFAARGDANNLNRVLRQFAPICCFLGDEEMAAITAEALA